jgi:hypothetical protein
MFSIARVSLSLTKRVGLTWTQNVANHPNATTAAAVKSGVHDCFQKEKEEEIKEKD